MDKMKEIPFIIPPVDKQTAIVEHIKTTIPRLETTIDKMVKVVKILGEYIIRLMSDVVTGKVNVRYVEIPNYEYVEKENEALEIDEDESNV